MTTNSTAGTIPSGDWKSIARKWRATGEWGEYASRHASNALVTIMQPERGDAGRYILCVGAAHQTAQQDLAEASATLEQLNSQDPACAYLKSLFEMAEKGAKYDHRDHRVQTQRRCR